MTEAQSSSVPARTRQEPGRGKGPLPKDAASFLCAVILGRRRRSAGLSRDSARSAVIDIWIFICVMNSTLPVQDTNFFMEESTMQNRRKLMTILLLVVVVVGMLSMSAFAVDVDDNGVATGTSILKISVQ